MSYEVPVALSLDYSGDMYVPHVTLDVRAYFLGDDAGTVRHEIEDRIRAFLATMPPIILDPERQIP